MKAAQTYFIFRHLIPFSYSSVGIVDNTNRSQLFYRPVISQRLQYWTQYSLSSEVCVQTHLWIVTVTKTNEFITKKLKPDILIFSFIVFWVTINISLIQYTCSGNLQSVEFIKDKQRLAKESNPRLKPDQIRNFGFFEQIPTVEEQNDWLFILKKIWLRTILMKIKNLLKTWNY